MSDANGNPSTSRPPERPTTRPETHETARAPRRCVHIDFKPAHKQIAHSLPSFKNKRPNINAPLPPEPALLAPLPRNRSTPWSASLPLLVLCLTGFPTLGSPAWPHSTSFPGLVLPPLPASRPTKTPRTELVLKLRQHPLAKTGLRDSKRRPVSLTGAILQDAASSTGAKESVGKAGVPHPLLIQSLARSTYETGLGFSTDVRPSELRSNPFLCRRTGYQRHASHRRSTQIEEQGGEGHRRHVRYYGQSQVGWSPSSFEESRRCVHYYGCLEHIKHLCLIFENLGQLESQGTEDLDVDEAAAGPERIARGEMGLKDHNS
ncbi:uncharacterized protein BDZ99DRAFT_477186 [Mytilinidion resinicola]|uniref:Uncharacterized protein n=1 Tax=Mytilinidion resinicola TaxID=574789 RepID=A0A6A6YP81_9PEZI|nr:uncharacterized protein BDZ99DRAFT_477186 [Mytilinidion resinicola]KAF2809824.1 hypothetical protein BDZ99DRAFT_477186 [Mytilinidion resinicola]